MVRSLTRMSSMALGLALAFTAAPSRAQQLFDDAEPASLQSEQYDEGESTDSDSSDADNMPNEYALPESGIHDEDHGDHQHGDDASDEEAYSPEAADESGEPSTDTEVIKERFANGTVRVEREVTQDSAGNYVNHGMWKTWDERGNLVAQGEFEHGRRTGTWVRWYRGAADAKLLSQMPYQQFAGPFISQATFKDGQLDGAWTIYDGKQHKISQWHFVEGRRHGMSTWWFSTGRKMREIQYRDGDMDGELIEYGPAGSVLSKSTYQAGRKLASKTATHTGGAKKSQGMYLFAREMEQTPDDWWECKTRATTRQGKDEKHGPWSSWYANGQRQLEGTYEHDAQVGQFTWWHSNGQKALEGKFDLGKQDGSWTWWYPTGQKSIAGQYAHGNPTGRWTWWKEDGKVAQSADLSHSEGVVIDMPKVMSEPAKMPAQAKQPKARTQMQR